MAAFDLEASFQRARRRFSDSTPSRKKCSDIEVLRISPPVEAQVSVLLAGQERPPMHAVAAQLAQFCNERNLSCPSRSTIYKAMARLVVHRYGPAELPPAACQTLYNLDLEVPVPGHQLVFHCFNYGDLQAMSYAAGLPWLALYQAVRMRGWRAKSRGPLLAACRARRI